MELKKRLVHMSQTKGEKETLLTAEGDYNLPDVKPDMEKILMRQGEILIDGIHGEEGQARVQGRVLFDVLYSSAEGDAADCFSGSMSFVGEIPFPELTPTDDVRVSCHLEDLSVEMIHSRKLRARAAIAMTLRGEYLYDAEMALGARDEENSPQCKTEQMELVELAAARKGTYHVSEELELPGNRPNIQRILYSSVQLRGEDCRALEGRLAVTGELALFVLYSGEEEHIPLQWMERTFPIEAEFECPGSHEGQIVKCSLRVLHKDVMAKADYDGELRIIGLEAALEADIKLYEENRAEMLSDLYLPGKILEIHRSQARFQSLFLHNRVKCRVSEKAEIRSEDPVIQVCSCQGMVKLDQITPKEDGLMAEGAIGITVLYLTGDERMPLRSLETAIPFSQLIEVRGLNSDCHYEINPTIEQLDGTGVGSHEMEFRAVLDLDTLVLQDISRPVVESVAVKEIPEEVIARMPGLVGYIVQPGDTLWDVAKRFYTTTEQILAGNSLQSGELKPGDRLLIRKKTERL